ncbi:hypothetical protein BDW75DRAFT_246608 [Aspergillus navahoensis]
MSNIQSTPNSEESSPTDESRGEPSGQTPESQSIEAGTRNQRNMPNTSRSPREKQQEREKIVQLEQHIQELERKYIGQEPYTRKRRHDGIESEEETVKIEDKDITKYSTEFSLQQRLSWLANMRRNFEGAPKKYRTDRQKILGSLIYMDQTCKDQWERHAQELVDNNCQNDTRSWPHFEEWTYKILRSSMTSLTAVMVRLDRAHQGINQDPRDFDIYLNSLEQYFDKEPERKRVETYFAKLQSTLRDKICDHNFGDLPETRDRLVAMASQYWSRMHRDPPKITSSQSNSIGNQEGNNQGSRGSLRDKGRGRGFRSRTGMTSLRYPSSTTEVKPHENGKEKTANPNGPDRKPLRCYNCGSTFHLANTCPKSKRHDNPNFIPRNNAQTAPAKTQEIKTLRKQEQDEQYMDWASETYPEQSGNDDELE